MLWPLNYVGRKMHKVDLDKAKYNILFEMKWHARFARSLWDVPDVPDWLNSQVCHTDMYIWCVNSIKSDWNFYLYNKSDRHISLDEFYFEFKLIEDAMAFKLRWL